VFSRAPGADSEDHIRGRRGVSKRAAGQVQTFSPLARLSKIVVSSFLFSCLRKVYPFPWCRGPLRRIEGVKTVSSGARLVQRRSLFGCDAVRYHSRRAADRTIPQSPARPQEPYAFRPVESWAGPIRPIDTPIRAFPDAPHPFEHVDVDAAVRSYGVSLNRMMRPAGSGCDPLAIYDNNLQFRAPRRIRIGPGFAQIQAQQQNVDVPD